MFEVGKTRTIMLFVHIFYISLQMAPPDEQTLRILAANIGQGWKKTGTFLGFTWPKLQQFETNNPHSAEDAIFEMFYTWQAKQSLFDVNSTEKLRVALKKADQHLICDKLFPPSECNIK